MPRITPLPLLALVLAVASPAQKDRNAWAEGVPFHTEWKAAIDDVKATGKLLFIYNGWRDPGI